LTIIPAVIAWAFTLTFLIALALILLDVAGVRRIADAGQRKWLFRSLLGSVIMAVTGFGAWQFEAFRRPAEPAPQQVIVAPKETPQSVPPPAPRTEEAISPQPAQPQAPTPASPARSDAELATWAAVSLGERPGIPAAFESTYPACAAQLGGQTYAEIDPADASACRTQLNAHHYRYIVGFYRAKEAYDRALNSQDAALRRGGIQPDETTRYNFVLSENEDFNDPGGPTLRSIEQAEARVLQDRTACRTRRCSRGERLP